MKRFRVIRFLFLLSPLLHALVLMWAPNVYAPKQPTIVVAGEVKSITGKKEGGLIYSYVGFFVHHVKNGSASLRNTEIIVKHLGGEFSGLLLWRSDQPYFFVGEFAELILEPEDQVFKVVGGHRGKIRLDQKLQPISRRTVAGYRLIWFKPPSEWQDSTSSPGSGWYGPLRWSSNGFEYSINTQAIPADLSVSSFITYSTASFQTWEDDLGSSFDFTYRGTRSDTIPGTGDGVNLVGWSSIGGGTIAQTWLWATYVFGNYDSLRIIETDMEFDNSKLWSAQPSGVAGRFDVQNIGTHEAGHTFGLGDLYDPEDSEQTMYGYGATGETKKRTLEWGDQAGIRALYPGPALVQTTITSSPTGLGFVVIDGTPITTPQVFTWIEGSTHTLAANSPVSGGTGIQYVWLSWSDGGSQSHAITVPSSPSTYTANFKRQYMLTVSVSPTGGGALSASTGWRDEGTTVPVMATPDSGYFFYYWSLDGANVGSSPSYSVLMNAPHSLTAFFRGTSSLSFGLSPESVALGDSVTLSGTLTPTQPTPGIPIGAVVALSYSLNGSTWISFITAQTGSGGAYSVVWYPPYRGSYQIKATWSGDQNYEGATSTVKSLTVTGAFPPRVSLLITGPASSAKGGSAAFDVLVTNPGSSLSTTLHFEVTGPGGYRYSDSQQIAVGASEKGRFQFVWQIPSAVSAGQYQILVSLIPPKPTAIAQTQVTIT